jgi:lipopolysaccharide transport system ATP-binding protein
VFSDGTLFFDSQNSKEGVYTLSARVPSKLLNSGNYTLMLVFGENKRYLLEKFENIVSFTVELGKDIKHDKRQKGSIYQELDWSFDE